MKNKNNISENPLENAPFLSKIEKINHFSTPENYFEELHQIINDKILENKSLYLNFYKLAYRFFAPVLVISTVILLFFYFNPSPSNTEATATQISDVLINEEYINLDEDLIIETYAEMIEETYESSNTEEDYINYLIENDIDINTIITEL